MFQFLLSRNVCFSFVLVLSIAGQTLMSPLRDDGERERSSVVSFSCVSHGDPEDVDPDPDGLVFGEVSRD